MVTFLSLIILAVLVLEKAAKIKVEKVNRQSSDILRSLIFISFIVGGPKKKKKPPTTGTIGNESGKCTVRDKLTMGLKLKNLAKKEGWTFD